VLNLREYSFPDTDNFLYYYLDGCFKNIIKDVIDSAAIKYEYTNKNDYIDKIL
jgi:hypothetical protein